MLKYIIRRLLIALPVVFLMILVTFVLVQAMPGGPFDAVGQKAMPEHIKQVLERKYGLDKPVSQQFWGYFTGILQGDLGPMLRRPGSTVNDVVSETFPVSIQLGLLSVGLGFVIGIPLGIVAALYHNTAFDYTATFFAVLGVSIPNLVLGPVMIYSLAVGLDWFPVAFWGPKEPYFLDNATLDYFHHAAMPVMAIGTGMAASIARLTRAGLLDVLNSDYIRTARAKGLRERIVIGVHALKNSLIPVVTILGPLLAGAVTGSFVVEQIFAINGMGRRFVTSIGEREYFLQTGLVLLYGILLIGGNLLVDILYAWFDPRIRYD
ncbi:MAG: ABC transporter permease [Candidatus Promineifilaceae bacterium]|nr:ABC transporter permease [Candidatus Promineifilaceae bacterium]